MAFIFIQSVNYKRRKTMCCRYYVPEEMSEFMILKYLDSLERKRAKSGEIYPTDLAPVIKWDNMPAVSAMRWGFKIPKGVVFNARGETLEEKNLFRPHLENRVAAFCGKYYEWREKVKYAVKRESGRAIFLTGFYRPGAGGENEFTIITVPPKKAISYLHDRMPLALDEELAIEWVSGRVRDISELYSHTPDDLYFEKAV